jgi:nucleoside diphosphate kinase
MMLNDFCDLILGLNFLNVERAFAGPVVAMIWEGKNVVLTGRKIIGATNPAQSEPGTIRGDFAIDIGRYRHVSVPIFLFSYSEL